MEYMTVEEQGMVTTLMAVAGIQDVNFAREFLQDNGWQLEISVNAYMMMIGEESGMSLSCPEESGGMGGMSSSSPESPRARPPTNPPLRPVPAPPANPPPRPAPVLVQRVRPVANPPPRPAHAPSVKSPPRPAPAPVERRLVDDMPGVRLEGPGMKRAAEDVSKLVECAVCLYPFQSEGI